MFTLILACHNYLLFINFEFQKDMCFLKIYKKKINKKKQLKLNRFSVIFMAVSSSLKRSQPGDITKSRTSLTLRIEGLLCHNKSRDSISLYCNYYITAL